MGLWGQLFDDCDGDSSRGGIQSCSLARAKSFLRLIHQPEDGVGSAFEGNS